MLAATTKAPPANVPQEKVSAKQIESEQKWTDKSMLAIKNKQTTVKDTLANTPIGRGKGNSRYASWGN
jgi:hypothetical protein